MPVELLVPIAIFFGGAVVSSTLGGLGVELIKKGMKK